RQLKVTYNGSTESGMALLVINADDPALPSSSDSTLWNEIPLLGKKNGPLAEVVPSTVTFPVGVSPTIERQFVVRNIGTKPLEVKKKWRTRSDAAPAEFKVPGLSSGSTTSIPPGGQMPVAIQMVDKLSQATSGLAVELPSNTVGNAQAVGVTGVDMPETVAKIERNFAKGSLTPGQVATLSGAKSKVKKNGVSVSGYEWFVLDRPSSSEFFNAHTLGSTFKIRPDVAGTYKIGLSVISSRPIAGDQTTAEITVQSN
ncbi:MAG: hypothetical protein ABEL76_01270, partial [Bradymonadaceae bacterium]